jgi:hypothetical protein
MRTFLRYEKGVHFKMSKKVMFERGKFDQGHNFIMSKSFEKQMYLFIDFTQKISFERWTFLPSGLSASL